MKDWSWLNWGVIVIYFMLVGLLAIIFSKRQYTSRQYFVGSGRLPAFVVACSVYATMLSSISYLSIPATIYRTNWTNGLAPLGIIAVIITVAYVFVPFIRRLQVVTAYEYLEYRFDKGLRIISALTFILFQTIRIAVVVYLPTLAITVVLPDVNLIALVLIVSFFCIAYTSVGGIESVVWSDFIQTIVLIAGAITVIWFGFSSAPGSLMDIFMILHEDKKVIPQEALSFSLPTSTVWVIFIGTYFNALYDYIGNQAVVQRFSAVKNLAEARRLLFINIPLLLLSVILFIGMGSAIYLYYKFNGPAPELARPDAILPYMIITAFPPVFSGLVVAALLAAAQSTISSALNSISASVVFDIIDSKQQLSERMKLKLAKYVSWSIGILSLVFTVIFIQSGQNNVFLYIQVITAMLGGPISVVFLIGIFFRKASSIAAWSGFVTSSCIALFLTNPLNIVNFFFPRYTTPTLYEFTLPIFIIGGGVAIGYIISLLFPHSQYQRIQHLTIAGLQDTTDII